MNHQKKKKVEKKEHKQVDIENTVDLKEIIERKTLLNKVLKKIINEINKVEDL